MTILEGLSITAVIGRYVELKPVGREWWGLCPFHSEKTASFHVNQEKGVFFCSGCQEGGDLIHFIQKFEGVDFKGALDLLGTEGQPMRTQQDRRVWHQAERIVHWAEITSRRVAEKLREIGQAQRLIRQFEDKDLAAWKLNSLNRQWTILERVDSDLFDPQCLPEFYEQGELIERLLNP